MTQDELITRQALQLEELREELACKQQALTRAEGLLLRDYFAAQVVSAVFHGVFEDWRQNKAGIQEDWPTGIAVDAYRVADAMLRIREAT